MIVHIRFYLERELLIKLVKENNWSFVFEKERITCGKTTQQVKLQHQGILKLREDCIYTIDNWLIPFENNVEEEGGSRQWPEMENFAPIVKNEYVNQLNFSKFNDSVLTIADHSKYNEIQTEKSRSIAELEKDILDVENHNGLRTMK